MLVYSPYSPLCRSIIIGYNLFMADMRPIGIDQTTGQQRTVDSTDSVVNNIGNQLSIVVTYTGDFSGIPNLVQVVFPWSETPNIIENPASLPSDPFKTAWSPNGEFLSINYLTAPGVALYQRTGSSFNLLTEPASIPSSAERGSSFSNDGQFLALGTTNAVEKMVIYQRDGIEFTKLTTPASLGIGSTFDIAFSPTTEFLAIVSGGSGLDRRPYLRIYQRDGTTFTKIADPASLPEATENTRNVAWSPDGRYLAIATELSPFLRIYARTGIDEFTILPAPASLPTAAGRALEWSPDGQLLAVATNNNVVVYAQNGSTFTLLLDNPASVTSGTKEFITWSPDGNYLLSNGTNNVDLYGRTSDNTLALLDSPASNGAGLRDAAWSPDGQFLYVQAQTGGLQHTFYQTSVSLPESGVVVIKANQLGS